MSSNITEHPSFENPTVSSWEPSRRCRRWLFIGMIMLAADLVLGVLATALEFRHWGEEGLTQDVLIAYAAIVPQIVLAFSYLVLAREADARGLWKSVAGLLGSYLLVCLISLVFVDILPNAGNMAVVVAAAVGMLALFGFSISAIPKFREQAGTKPASADQTALPSESEPNESPSAGNLGWIGGIAIFIVFVVLKGLVRRFIRPAFRAGFAVDDWALFAFIALIAFGLTFAVWFAITKIRLRERLGMMACVAGVTEILILLIHIAMAAIIFAVMITEAAAAPQLDDAGIERLFDPWMKRASLMVAASHVVWILVTLFFFASVRTRFNGDWHEEPTSAHER